MFGRLLSCSGVPALLSAVTDWLVPLQPASIPDTEAVPATAASAALLLRKSLRLVIFLLRSPMS